VLLALVVLVILYRALLIRRFRRHVAAQHEAYLRGDYEGQLQTAETCKTWAPAEHHYFRGRALFQLGRMDEAEVCLAHSSNMDYDRHKIALYKDQLGQVLLELQRYDEAIVCFLNGVKCRSQNGNCQRGIAAALLCQGVRAAEALVWANWAKEIDEADRTAAPYVGSLQLYEARDWNLGESLATLAWAEVVNARDAAKVDDLTEHLAEHWLIRAFRLCPETAVPVRAKVHYHAGLAYSALRKTEESFSQFERAASLDPNGHYGRLAKAASRLERSDR
jgi:tetratricopeptide (TPR) repeat protein